MRPIKGVLLPQGFDLSRAYDIQACVDGVATKEQAQAAVKHIVEDLCGVYRSTVDADPRKEALKQGMREAGLAVVAISKLKLATVKKLLDQGEDNERNRSKSKS